MKQEKQLKWYIASGILLSKNKLVMDLNNSKCLVIGGAGFIGSFVVTELLKENVAEVIVYDNFARGKKEYLDEALKDSRCKIYPVGGDIREIDILNDAMKGVDYVFCLAAMWLLHCCDLRPDRREP